MILAQLDLNGIVLNTIVNDELIDGYVECPEHVGIGMHIDTPVQLTIPLSEAKAKQIDLIESAYANAVGQPIDYMGTTFQADADSQTLLIEVMGALGGESPPGFGWWDTNNVKVPMNFAQLQGLSLNILLRGQPLFDQKQARKAFIRDAETDTVAKVEAIIW